MPYTEKIGTFSFALYDAAEAELAVVSLRGATLRVQTEALAAANPNTYRWQYFITGESSWNGSANFVQITTAAGTGQDAALSELEAAAMEGRVITVKFISPMTNPYSGEAIITTLDLGGAFNEIYQGSLELQGRDELIKGPPAAPTGLATPTTSGSGITITWD